MTMIAGMGANMGNAWYQEYQNEQRHNREKELMGIQLQNQRQLNREQANAQMKMWHNTNYDAQVHKLRQAGLNPALLYAKGGQGGTTGSIQGGSAAKGSAGYAPFMDMSVLKYGKEMELLEAQTRKLNTESDRIAGIETELLRTEIKDLNKGIELKEAQKNYTEMNTKLNEVLRNKANADTMKVLIDAKNIILDTKLKQVQLGVDKKTADIKVQLAKQSVLINEINMKLSKAGINKTYAEINKINNDIKLNWMKFGLDKKGLTEKQRQNNIDKFEAEMKVKYPTVWQAIGRIFNDAMRLGQAGDKTYDNLLWWFGLEREDREKVE